MRFCQRNLSLESYDPGMLLLANKFLPIHQSKAHLLQGASFPFPLHLLHPSFTFSSIILKLGWFVCFLIDTLGLAVIHQTNALSLSAGCIFGCSYNTLKVG